MANIAQVTEQIRFGLEQLSSKNAHHEFEHLCRHLARVRICSNILPATGPVSAGGDQGRDFETFKTYLSQSPIANSSFLGLVSEGPLAFACSIQKEIIPKIKSDVNTILMSGSPVVGIHYFCTSNVPVARLHELQSWAKKSHSIELVIHDGNAISELLSDQEIFWIAEQYLSIPSEIYPTSPTEDDDWYKQSLAKWRGEGIQVCNFASFSQVKACARHAFYSTELRQDVPFLINQLQIFIEKDNLPPTIKRNAIYEVAVLSLRGLGSLLGQENRLREYFGAISELDDPADLKDTVVLLNYCIGADYANKVQLTSDEICEWHGRLLRKIEEQLASARTPGQRCFFLDIRGYISLCIDPSKKAILNLDDAFKFWIELTQIVKDAPLFPLEEFADHLTDFAVFIGEHPQYDPLTHQVDSLLSERYGAFIAGEKCKDRAIKFYDNGNILKAINQLHKTKVDWFADEALYGSLIAMLQISQWYRELGLCFAAKYYSLAVAFISANLKDSKINSLVSRALISAAECDYHQGAWCSFLELTDLGLRAHGMLSKDPGDPAIHHEIEATIYHSNVLLAITERIASQFSEYVASSIRNWQIDDWISDLLPAARDAWKSKGVSEIWKDLEEQLTGRPFSDVGANREVSWSALGIDWSINWINDYHTTPSAEQFAAVLQITLADLANLDLCLLKTRVNIKFSAQEIKEPLIEAVPSNVGRKWQITLPICTVEQKDELKKIQDYACAFADAILFEISLLPSERFIKVLEDRFREGVSMKVFVAKPYEVLYREFIPQKIFDISNRTAKIVPELHRPFSISSHKELDWFAGPEPGYSKEKAEESLKNRYENVSKSIPYTLERLLSNPDFAAAVVNLRADGWLNWHILQSVFTATLNYRARQHQEAKNNFEEHKRVFLELMDEVETESSTLVPFSEYTEQRLRFFLPGNMLSTAKVLGLECHQETPDVEAIDHFLRVRYNYWTDDIEHDDPFPWPNLG